jgi:hypothetical protein
MIENDIVILIISKVKFKSFTNWESIPFSHNSRGKQTI